MKKSEHLQWLYDRIVNVYGESENVDFLIKFREIIKDIELPYIKSLEPYGLKQDEMKLVLSTIFNQSIRIRGRSVYNTNGNRIYYETSNGYWVKYEYDTNGNKIYSEDSNGFWRKYEYDTNDNQIYSEDSNGYWYKKEYDEQGREVYYENSNGYIEDNRYERQI
jgi:hypothetical protein